TNHGFRRSVLGRSGSPGKAETRSPILVVVDQVLEFVPQAKTQGEVRANLPIVLNKRRGVAAYHAHIRIAGLNGELARPCAHRLNLRAGITLLLQLQGGNVLLQPTQETECPIEALRILVLIAVPAYARPEMKSVGAVGHGAGVGELEMLGEIVLVANTVAAAGELVGHADFGSEISGCFAPAALELEARLIHQVGGENRCFGHHQVLRIAAGVIGQLIRKVRSTVAGGQRAASKSLVVG